MRIATLHKHFKSPTENCNTEYNVLKYSQKDRVSDQYVALYYGIQRCGNKATPNICLSVHVVGQWKSSSSLIKAGSVECAGRLRKPPRGYL